MDNQNNSNVIDQDEIDSLLGKMGNMDKIVPNEKRTLKPKVKPKKCVDDNANSMKIDGNTVIKAHQKYTRIKRSKKEWQCAICNSKCENVIIHYCTGITNNAAYCPKCKLTAVTKSD